MKKKGLWIYPHLCLLILSPHLAQMHSLTDEFDTLQEVKDVELERLEQELREANEEIQSLHLDAEEAAALHENEIARLQEELCRLKAELERVQHVRNEYDMEITTLKAEISMKTPGTGDSQPSPELPIVPYLEDRGTSTSEEVTKLQGTLGPFAPSVIYLLVCVQGGKSQVSWQRVSTPDRVPSLYS